jgi:hypothetical protein
LKITDAGASVHPHVQSWKSLYGNAGWKSGKGGESGRAGLVA